MDLKLIHRLIRMMDRGEVSELEIDDEQAGLRIRLRRGPGGAGPHSPVVGLVQGSAVGPMAPMAAMPPAQAGGAPTAAEGNAAASEREGLVEIESPMVGTLYRAASPDTDPFVEVGSTVDEEAVVCIIEAMKVMNEIKAETRGEIVEILVDNGEPVEFGQPLFLVKPT
jgi:acetyl-CoA carboxylase biotin carboxyl carrier protein